LPDTDDSHGVTSVPFYSQKVDWAGEDSGFPNAEEVARWQSNCCGIACARMIIDHFTGVKVRYWDLLQLGLRLNAYNEIGWIHRGLVEMIAHYEVLGRAQRGKDLQDLKRSIYQGAVCIVSVSVGFRGGLPRPGTNDVYGRGGHLVVAYQNICGELACNHPSSLDEWNRENWVVSDELWENSISGAYMEFFPSGRP